MCLDNWEKTGPNIIECAACMVFQSSDASQISTISTPIVVDQDDRQHQAGSGTADEQSNSCSKRRERQLTGETSDSVTAGGSSTADADTVDGGPQTNMTVVIYKNRKKAMKSLNLSKTVIAREKKAREIGKRR